MVSRASTAPLIASRESARAYLLDMIAELATIAGKAEEVVLVIQLEAILAVARVERQRQDDV